MKEIVSNILIVALAIALFGGSVLTDGSQSGVTDDQPPVIGTIWCWTGTNN